MTELNKKKINYYYKNQNIWQELDIMSHFVCKNLTVVIMRFPGVFQHHGLIQVV